MPGVRSPRAAAGGRRADVHPTVASGLQVWYT